MYHNMIIPFDSISVDWLMKSLQFHLPSILLVNILPLIKSIDKIEHVLKINSWLRSIWLLFNQFIHFSGLSFGNISEVCLVL